MQYRDIPGNASISFSDNIDYTGGVTNISINVPSGNAYFSLNISGTDMSLNSVLSTLPLVNDDNIKNQSYFASYYQGSWYGTLSMIDPKEMYHIRMTNGGLIQYSGLPIDVINTPINLSAGWTWIGYLPQVPLSINQALSSLTLNDGDFIKDIYGYSEYWSGSWYGSINTMQPFYGYKIKLLYADVLTYPSGGSKATIEDISSLPIFDNQTGITVNPYDFQFSGVITADIVTDNQFNYSDKDLLLAYVGNDCRGIAFRKYFEPANTYIFPLMVYSNENETETISFKYYNSDYNLMFNCIETVEFVSDMIIANAMEPFQLHIENLVDVSEHISQSTFLNIYPNPFRNNTTIEYFNKTADRVKISVYDIYGKLYKTLRDEWCEMGKHTITWETLSLPFGTYYIKMTSGNDILVKKVIHMN